MSKYCAAMAALLLSTVVYADPGDLEKLPPEEKRKVIGVWSDIAVSHCNQSFEQVGQKVYRVDRCLDGSGGNEGMQLKKINSKKFYKLPFDRLKSYYVIKSNGDLEVRDSQGYIETLVKANSAWPSNKSPQREDVRTSEDKKTIGLDCSEIGYRYGHTSTSSMKGKVVNPKWDFAIPDRCRNDPKTNKGIMAGTRAAW